MSHPTRNLAVVYKGTKSVAVEDIGYPKMQDPQGKPIGHGVILKVIVTNICGSDLHMYNGRTSFEKGNAFGHEITGEVFELGPEVELLQKGDWVSIPFNIACGKCENCKERKTSACLRVNPKQHGGGYGYADMGGWQGGQAEYVLVPYADFNCLKIPKNLTVQQMKDIALLSDVFPTAMNGAVQAGVKVGSYVYIAGCGPIGIAAAASSFLLGAAAVVMGDIRANRLEAARKIGAIGVDLTKISSDEKLGEEFERLIGRKEVDCAIECVGYECCGIGSQSNVNIQESVLNTCFNVVKAGGYIGIPGVYLPADPAGVSPNLRNGILPLQFGAVWNKALTLQMGQCPVMTYNAALMETILNNRVSVADAMNIQFISLQEAPAAFKRFADGEHIKFIIDPHGMMSKLPTSSAQVNGTTKAA